MSAPSHSSRGSSTTSGTRRGRSFAAAFARTACFINRTDVHRPRPYEYLSYDFANMSKDIVGLFVAACDQVGVITRVNCDRRGRWQVRINQRESVALMLEHVARKE